MRMLCTLGTLVVLICASAYAETYTGKLLDSDCRSKNPNEACTPTASTASFALEVSGKTYKFDEAGNKKAAEAFEKSQSGAERAKEPEREAAGITATVDGSLRGEQIEVSTITVQ